ncbi:MAG: TRAP transporter substrate-binding protein DctP [Desulfarculaceae bacterium]|nr:TRAP transporter substrate-binding protein DctP [Desulfarculaceae bacterium]MCF8072889.1 TRAP transporter substrate-binding protein DctP [Desulfarculaceae bacterium]MCF8101057.1 TRAP transporter substrate-binding protein DctP [Desulfarculaceae bacterium]MCF8115556.1 TRAP transporter substrate-binding protein DctP [Desulfarculaceae bacterium]
MKVKSFIAGVVVFLAACAFMIPAMAGPATAADKVITWKCQVHWPSSSSSYKGSLLVVIERLKKRTNGRLIIEPYAAGSLVPPKEIFNAVKRGMIPIGVTSASYPRAQVPIMSVACGLPANFGAVWEAVYYYKWMGFEEMVRAEVAKHGMYYASDKVYPTELSLKNPVRKFEDFKGLKLRSSGTMQVFLTSVGASASYIPGSEIYAALASGVVDGAHWGAVQGNNSMKFYELNKYHLRPSLCVASTDIWLVNKKAMAKLPADLRKILIETLEEEFWLRTNQYQYLEDLTLSKIIKEDGVELITLPPAEYAKLQAAALKMWDEVAKKGPACAKAVEMLKEFNRKMGRIK